MYIIKMLTPCSYYFIMLFNFIKSVICNYFYMQELLRCLVILALQYCISEHEV